jgi:hypothetical protein
MNYDTLLKDNGLRPMITSDSEVYYKVVMDDGAEYAISYKLGKWGATLPLDRNNLIDKIYFLQIYIN